MSLNNLVIFHFYPRMNILLKCMITNLASLYIYIYIFVISFHILVSQLVIAVFLSRSHPSKEHSFGWPNLLLPVKS